MRYKINRQISMKTMGTKKQIGTFAVDSGSVLICDPCYLTDWKDNEPQFDNKDKSFSFNGSCNVSCNEEQGGQLTQPGAGGNHFNIGVACATGFGDGEYPVIAHYKNYGTKEKPDIRIRKIEVIFIQ